MKEQIISSINLLCLDIDGTLLNTSHQLPPENRAAVQYAAKQGVTVCLMSARPPQAIFPIQQALGVPGPVASFGGALIWMGDKRVYDRRLPAASVLPVLDEGVRHGVHVSVYRDLDWFVETEDRWSRNESAITGLSPIPGPLHDRIQNWDLGAHKLLCMGEPAQIDAMMASIHDNHLDCLRSKAEYLEIVPAGTGKADAMQVLCDRLGIDAGQTMAMGDHDIDCGLLRAAAVGIAMGNASPAAKQAARCVTGSNDQAGVAQAIYQWI